MTSLQETPRPNKKQIIWLLCVLAATAVAMFFIAASSTAVTAEAAGFVTEKGQTYYFDPNTHEPLKGQKKINGYWYMFEPETGAMVKGFYHHTEATNAGGEKTCYYDLDGHMIYGQKRIEDYWYNFRYGSGAMQTGFVEIPGQKKTCYYDSEGRMLYGEQVIDGKTYVFEEGTGALLAGAP